MGKDKTRYESIFPTKKKVLHLGCAPPLCQYVIRGLEGSVALFYYKGVRGLCRHRPYFKANVSIGRAVFKGHRLCRKTYLGPSSL